MKLRVDKSVTGNSALILPMTYCAASESKEEQLGTRKVTNLYPFGDDVE